MTRKKKLDWEIVFLMRIFFPFLADISISLKKTEDIDATSIAFPSLSSGIFGFPKDKSAEIIVQKCIE